MLVRDLNRLYRQHPALHHYDFEHKGFSWIDCHDAAQSIISYTRHGIEEEDEVLVILNFTPVPRHGYRIGVGHAGSYQEILNSDSQYYGGSNVGNVKVETEILPWMGKEYSLSITLPPLGGVILQRKKK